MLCACFTVLRSILLTNLLVASWNRMVLDSKHISIYFVALCLKLSKRSTLLLPMIPLLSWAESKPLDIGHVTLVCDIDFRSSVATRAVKCIGATTTCHPQVLPVVEQGQQASGMSPP